MKHLILLAVLFLSGCTGKQETREEPITGCYRPETTDRAWYTSGKKAPLLEGLEGINFPLSATGEEVRRYFNQGMILSYGYNHAEAARSFYEAARLDSACAMAWWGYAYVLGPNYNGGMEDDNYQRAYQAARRAQKLSGTCSPMERALIKALVTRYEEQPPADRSHLDIAYAAAMKKVYEQFPADPDVGALYAEALMNLHPWDWYEKDSEKPKAWTSEVVNVLEHLIKAHPLHPGAHHFYIHVMEASATPEKALPSARLLDTLVPGAGHLVHMPSHIYIRTGNYHLGTLSNLQAAKVDSLYTTACHAQGVYPLSYYPHNYHFLAATAALEGNSRLAWMAAGKLQQHTAIDLMDQPSWGTLQHYYTIPYYIGVKFEMWDTLLALPTPPKELVYPMALRHYARGMAYLGKNNTAAAMKESLALQTLAGDTTLRQITVWDINTTADLAQIAIRVLSAEIAARNNQLDSAVSLLQQAIAIEDQLNYNEPPDWFFSVRHHLGAVLLKAEKYKEAELIYREDLRIWKKNGWALSGLHRSLLLQKKNREARTVKAAFDQAWQYADFSLGSSVKKSPSIPD